MTSAQHRGINLYPLLTVCIEINVRHHSASALNLQQPISMEMGTDGDVTMDIAERGCHVEQHESRSNNLASGGAPTSSSTLQHVKGLEHCRYQDSGPCRKPSAWPPAIAE
jgi:hypothetical protein